MKRIFSVILAALMLAGCSAQQTAPETTAAATTATETTAAAETTLATEAETTVATEAETTAPETTAAAKDPIYADQIVDGTYEITVESSSSMFKVVKCELVVEDGKMNATMTMSGQGYGKLYMGTGEEALADSEENYIPFTVNEDESKTFTVPVEALDLETNCAAWSIKKEKWYDRVLVFESTQLPAEALRAE